MEAKPIGGSVGVLLALLDSVTSIPMLRFIGTVGKVAKDDSGEILRMNA